MTNFSIFESNLRDILMETLRGLILKNLSKRYLNV